MVKRKNQTEELMARDKAARKLYEEKRSTKGKSVIQLMVSDSPFSENEGEMERDFKWQPAENMVALDLELDVEIYNRCQEMFFLYGGLEPVLISFLEYCLDQEYEFSPSTLEASAEAEEGLSSVFKQGCAFVLRKK